MLVGEYGLGISIPLPIPPSMPGVALRGFIYDVKVVDAKGNPVKGAKVQIMAAAGILPLPVTKMPLPETDSKGMAKAMVDPDMLAKVTKSAGAVPALFIMASPPGEKKVAGSAPAVAGGTTEIRFKTWVSPVNWMLWGAAAAVGVGLVVFFTMRK